jgi:hypothetical protein
MTQVRLVACLLHNDPATYRQQQAEGLPGHRRSESECEERVELLAVDPKLSDLAMRRLKRG